MAQVIPSNIRVPFVYVNFDPSRASTGPSILKYKVLAMGQKLASGASKAELSVDTVRDGSEANDFYGQGSQLGRMLNKWFENNSTTEIKAISINDAGTAVKAAGSIVLTGTATAQGIVSILLNGTRIQVPVAVGDTHTSVATAIGTAINAIDDCPVDADAVTTPGTVALTAKNGGEEGNYIDVRQNYYDDDATPAGLVVSINALQNGAINPDITDIIDILGDEWFNAMIVPWVDSTNLTALETELTDRFGPIRMIDSVAFISKRGTLGELSTFGNGRNSPHVTCMHAYKIPNCPEEFAAAVAGQVTASAEADPARPFQTMLVNGILAPKITERFEWSENNTLLYDGISTFQVDDTNGVRIQRCITMYQKNDAGAADVAYLDVTTMFTLMFMRYDLRNTLLTKYPRAKLADDGGRLPSGMQIMTPKIGKAEVINIAKGWQDDLAIMEGLEAFKENLIVERDVSDKNRLNIYLRPNLVNQLRVTGATIQFLL